MLCCNACATVNWKEGFYVVCQLQWVAANIIETASEKEEIPDISIHLRFSTGTSWNLWFDRDLHLHVLSKLLKC